MFIVVDENNIIIDAASEQENLCSERKATKNSVVYEIDHNKAIFINDSFDPKTQSVIPCLEKNLQTPPEELNEIYIHNEMRRMAIENLKLKGILPSDYVDKLAIQTMTKE